MESALNYNSSLPVPIQSSKVFSSVVNSASGSGVSLYGFWIPNPYSECLVTILCTCSDADHGYLSRIRIFSISDPVSASDSLGILAQRIVSGLWEVWSGLLILARDPGSWVLPIPDPRVKKGNRSRIRKTVYMSFRAHTFWWPVVRKVALRTRFHKRPDFAVVRIRIWPFLTPGSGMETVRIREGKHWIFDPHNWSWQRQQYVKDVYLGCSTPSAPERASQRRCWSGRCMHTLHPPKLWRGTHTWQVCQACMIWRRCLCP